jgi:hypothetical protein
MTAKGLGPSRAALAGVAVLLLPFFASADSQPASGAASTTIRASAHLDFKIVIPAVLSMDMLDHTGGPRGVGALTIGIYANGHNATLAATVPASEQARGNLILSAAARKVISQTVLCAPGPPRTPTGASASKQGPSADGRVTCTASMP